MHDPVPYFWSEQLGRRVQYVGHHAGADTLVRRGDLAHGPAALFWLRAGTLLAALTVDRSRDLSQARRAVGEPVDAALLADPEVAVRDAVRTGTAG